MPFLKRLFGLEKSAPVHDVSSRKPVNPIAVGIAGTFDVENYGDLLFPFMAEAAFARRLQPFQIIPFSPNSRSARSWPFRVYSSAEIPEFLPSLSALLIGGGQTIRFDKGYPVAVDPEVNIPLASWLIPAALGALAGKPVIWNAIGAWTDSPPAPWYDDVVNRVLSASHFVGVRDAASQGHLRRTAPTVDIQLVPDTVFSLSRFWPLENESKEYRSWRKSLGVEGRYVVIQADGQVASHRATIEGLLRKLGRCTIVVLPICRCHGDRADGSLTFEGRVIDSPEWLAPKLISEIVGRSELVIATSLHACITGLSYGVPAVRVPGLNAADRKFELLDEFEGVAMIDDAKAADLVRRGRKIERRVVKCADQLDRYWDRVVDVSLHPEKHDSKRSMALMLGWASGVFGDIEAAALVRSERRQSAKA